ncbi:MAG TPA: hypothetical protein VF432_13535 [Thermoanaerobaculia bacterium]
MLRRNRVALLTLALLSLLPSIGNAAPVRGSILFLNGTPYDWRISDVRSDRMKQWNFPAVIGAGTNARAYVEYLDKDGFPYGEVTYSFGGTGLAFKVIGRQTLTNFDLKVELTNLALPGYPRGSTMNLGSIPGNEAWFMVAGKFGSFTSNFAGTAWMHDNLHVLGNRSLRHLCIPGAHDAGMSMVTGGTAYANSCNTITQVLPVAGQLRMGVRYFDLRPVISGGEFYTGHYTDTSDYGWQGTNGQSLASIIDGVNAYTLVSPELIVLHFSNDLNTDVGRPYRRFTQAEWDRLLFQLRRLNYRVDTFNHSDVDLTTVKLADLIGSQAAVLIVAEPADPRVSIRSLTTEGIYTTRNFPIYNQYAATDNVKKMMEDQLGKLQAQRPNPDAGYFLLSWTLTQSDGAAARCTFWLGGSILPMAREANRRLADSVLQASSSWTYPNILYIDAVESFDIAALAMAVNGKASRSPPQEYVIYKGSGADPGIYVAHSLDGNLSNGSAWNLIRTNAAINTSDTPGTVSFAGRVYVLYKGAGSDSRIYVAQSGGNILDGNAWSANPLNSAINTSTAPGVAILNGTPYMLYKGAGADTNVYIARSAGNRLGDGNSWSAQRLNPGINTNDAPAVAAFGGVLYLLYKGSGDSNIWIARSSGDVFDGNTWTANRLNPGISTDTAPGVVVYGGYLYVFYKGPAGDTNIYIARSRGRDVFDGTAWDYARLNPGINTTAAPKPVVVGDSLYLFYKGSGDDNIWIAEPQSPDVLDGEAWRWERLNPAINTSTGPGAATTW